MHQFSSYLTLKIHSLDKIVSSIKNISSDIFSDPSLIFHIDEKIFSLAFHREFLIIGSLGKIFGHKISTSGAILKRSWTVQLPINHDMSEVNSIWIDHENENIFAGCGDGNIYVSSLEDGQVIKTFKEHSDYIHSICGHDKLIASASEDGLVKFWDIRENSSVFALEPSKNPKINRAEFGKWVGSVCINKDWVATGGGPSLALYHLRNREPFQIFDFPKEIHCNTFIDDNLVVGGEFNAIHQYSLNGEMISEMATSGPSILSIIWQKHSENSILAACGTSNKIDVSTNFNYKDTTLNFYSK